LPGGRASSARQRLRLINACISALHIHGPSRTTVEKVVAIAGMSPGIVRFYFASKAAMLVASLEYLAAEFEQRVLVPVMQLRAEPVKAGDEIEKRPLRTAGLGGPSHQASHHATDMAVVWQPAVRVGLFVEQVQRTVGAHAL